MKILYAEDEKALSEAVVDILTHYKYIVDPVYNGEDAYDYAMFGDYDCVILDVMMPKKDGMQVLKELRQNGFKKPILLLTAKSQVEDRIMGLDAGADDYLPKPFDMGELLARLRAILRRGSEFHTNQLTYGDLELNIENGTLTCNGSSIILTKQEFRLMEQLMLNQNMYMDSENLLEKAWGFNSGADINNVWFYISQLRKRLSEIKSKVEIVSRRNFGYKLEKSL